MVAHVTNSSVSLLDPSTADRFGPLGDAAMAMVNAEINRQAAMIAYIDDFWLMMWVTLASVPLVARDPAQVEAMRTRALAIREKALGPDHADGADGGVLRGRSRRGCGLGGILRESRAGDAGKDRAAGQHHCEPSGPGQGARSAGLAAACLAHRVHAANVPSNL